MTSPSHPSSNACTSLEKNLSLASGLHLRQALEAELREAEAELHTEEENARQADAELAQAESELRELRDQAKELDGLEEQYWHAANHLSLSLRLHAQQRTSIQRKVFSAELWIARFKFALNSYRPITTLQ